MKYFSIIIIALLGMTFNAAAQQDAISRYFEKHVEDENFTVVYISAKMFEMLGKLDVNSLEDEEAAAVLDVVKDMKGLRVLTTEHNPMELYKEAIQTINTKEYEQLMTVRTDDENVQFLIREDGNAINELLLLVGGTDEFVMVSFIGNLDLNKISKLAHTLDVDGVEHLEQLEHREDHKNKEKKSKSY